MAVTSSKLRLHIADYIIFLGMVVICTGIGVIYGVIGRGAKSKETFFVGNRNMNFLPLAISLIVTFQSAVMMLGTPAEVYIYGTSVILMGLAVMACQIFAVFITPKLFIPLKVTSAFEYLQLRFNSRPTRMCGVVLQLITTLIYSGVVIYAPAVAIEVVTGFNKWITISTLATAGVIFTATGGIKSVIWTDVFQAAVMFIGIIVTIAKGTYDVGGIGKVWEIANKGGRLNVFNFDPDPTVRHTVWTLFLPTFVRACHYVFSQSTVQRVSAASSPRGATKMMALIAPIDLVLFTTVIVEGVVLYAYFSQQDVEPLSAGILTNPNQIVPYAVLILFRDYPGMPGLFLAALFAASLSTLSSCLSIMSIFVMEDILEPFIGNLPDKKQMVVAKLSVVGLGLAACLFCVMASYMAGSLMQICISLVSATTGPLIGIFLLGCFFPSTTAKGIFVGVVSGSSLCWILVLGQNFAPGVTKTPWLPLGNQTFCHNLAALNSSHSHIGYNVTNNCVPSDADADRPFNIFNLSYNLTAMIGVVSTIIVAVFASYMLGRNRPGDVNPAYLLPISDTWLVCLPRPLRRYIKQKGPQFSSGYSVSGGKSVDMVEEDDTDDCETENNTNNRSHFLMFDKRASKV